MFLVMYFNIMNVVYSYTYTIGCKMKILCISLALDH